MEDIPSPLRMHSGPGMRFLYGYLLYKAADTIHTSGGFSAHVIEPNGQLTPMGWSNLCLAATIPRLAYPRPLVAARGFLFASVSLEEPRRNTLCSYRGLRLRPLADLGFSASVISSYRSICNAGSMSSGRDRTRRRLRS